MKSKVLILAFLGVFLVSPLAMADTLVTGTGGWFDISVVPLNEAPPPFWDQGSLDGSNQNIGFLLTSTNVLKGLPVPNLQFLADNSGSPLPPYTVVNDVYFNGALSGQVETLLFTIAGNVNGNTLSAYNVANPGQTTPIFSGAVAPGSGVTTVYQDISYPQWGLKLSGPGGTFYSQVDPTGTANSSDTSSNFAFFRDSGNLNTWWIGVEDLANPIGTEGLGDYNDLVLKVATVPLPPTVLLMGSGLLGLGLLGWRRRRS